LKLPSESLAFALTGAAHALAQVTAGNALPRALSSSFEMMRATGTARGAIQDLSYRSLRQWGRAKALLALLTDKPIQQPRLHSLLCCALALLSETDAAYNEHTLVDQTVTACGADRELARAKGLVNAVLRRYTRERQHLLQQLQNDETAQWNYPRWWIDKVRDVWPAQWQSLLAAGNLQGPMSLRVNVRKSCVTDYLALLAQHGLAAEAIGPSAVRLKRPMPVTEIPGFMQGLVSVQDAGAQLAAPLLDVKAGMRVLDACAAPGGKTGHLLELADIDLTAVDQDPERLARVAQNLERLGLSARLLCADASRRDGWDGRLFDRILADVPCTASGIVRRHPDIRWLRRPEDARTLSTDSAAILDNLWKMLKPGGKLLLVTCSIWPEESADQAKRLVEHHGAIALDAPGQLLPVADPDQDHDGLFYALLQKRSV
jgi:16S rRNA (cytosine967-C5)-methyltransferase